MFQTFQEYDECQKSLLNLKWKSLFKDYSLFLIDWKPTQTVHTRAETTGLPSNQYQGVFRFWGKRKLRLDLDSDRLIWRKANGSGFIDPPPFTSEEWQIKLT